MTSPSEVSPYVEQAAKRAARIGRQPQPAQPYHGHIEDILTGATPGKLDRRFVRLVMAGVVFVVVVGVLCAVIG